MVIGEQKDIQEVKNAYKAYEEIDKVNPYSIDDLKMIKSYKADAVLVGEMFMRNLDNEKFKKEYEKFKGDI